MNKLMASCLVCFLLTSCGPAMTPQQQAFLEELANRPVTCVAGKDCEDKWNRAIEWVSGHSRMGMKTLSDSMIQTYSVSDGNRPPDRYPEFTVIRYARGNGRIMDFDSYCNHGFACNPSGLQLKASFVTFVIGPPPGVTVHPDGNGATKIIHSGNE